MTQVILKKRQLFISILTLLCCFPTAALADELDYLSVNNNSNRTNIVFLLDSSSSLLWSYINKSLVNPALFPTDEGAAKVLHHKAYFLSQLQNTDIIPATLDLSYDEKQCSVDSVKLNEGVNKKCPSYVPRWYVRKLDIIRAIMRDLLPVLKGTRVGFMRTGPNNHGFDAWEDLGEDPTIDTRHVSDPSNVGDNGSYVISAMQDINTNADALAVATKLDNNYIIADLYGGPHKSPMVESLYEGLMYFKGARSPWTKNTGSGWVTTHLNLIDTTAHTGGSPTTPYKKIFEECSDNHAIIVSDGAPTYDWAANTYIQALTGATVNPPLPSATKSNEADTLAAHTMLDEFTEYLAKNDLDTTIPGKQTITTHFVSTWADDDAKTFLEAARAKSGGFHHALDNITQLYAALKTLIEHIKSTSTPAVGYTVLATNESGNPFEPNSQAFVNIWARHNGIWTGNLKKYLLTENGALIGKNNTPFLINGKINPNSQSLWSDTQDGDSPLKGGAGDLMSAIGTQRYTYIGTNTAPNTTITQPKYLLSPTNNTLSSKLIGATTNAERTSLLNWAAGMDINDVDDDGDTTDIRVSLGDQINARPAIAHYSNGNTAEPVIFTGSNEGYLHAVDADTGQHLYSFLVPHFLPNLSDMQGIGGDKTYGIDGHLDIWHLDANNDFNLREGNSTDANEKLMLYFGLRKGGHAYYALDITNRTAPKLAWFIDNTQTHFTHLGESWSQPQFGSIITQNGTEKNVVILSGGFDPTLTTTSSATPQIGNTLYILDAETGEQYWSISNKNKDVQIPEMQYSIVSKPVILDSNQDGLIDSILYNDIRGQIFRCDLIKDTTFTDLHCRLLAQSQLASENLWFLGQLDAAIINTQGPTAKRALTLSLASGNRLNPTDQTEQNRIVVIFDQEKPEITDTPKPTIELTSLKNVTDQHSTKAATHGWYFNFSTLGEKSFSQTLIFNNSIFFSTYKPSSNDSSGSNTTDTCTALDMGSATVYGLELSSGNGIKSKSNITGKTKGKMWIGKARGLPDTPYIVTKAAGSSLQATLNLGIDQTNLTFEVNPLKRTFWYQKQ